VVTSELLLLAEKVNCWLSASEPFRGMCNGEPDRRVTSASGARTGVAVSSERISSGSVDDGGVAFKDRRRLLDDEGAGARFVDRLLSQAKVFMMDLSGGDGLRRGGKVSRRDVRSGAFDFSREQGSARGRAAKGEVCSCRRLRCQQPVGKCATGFVSAA
jgi:hypothetical protein